MVNDFFRNRRVLLVTTKNLDYLRNTQELRLLNEVAATVSVCGSGSRRYWVRLLQVFWRLAWIRANRFDAVLWGFAPQLTRPFWRWKFRKCRQGVDFFISLYDTCVCDRTYFRPGSMAAKFLHWLDCRTLRGVDLTICDTRAHGDFFAAEFQADPRKIAVLYLEADSAIYRPTETAAAIVPKKELNVLYFGSILPLQGIDVILQAIDLLAGDTRLHFTLIGPLPEASRRHLSANPRVTLYPFLSQTALAAEIGRADLCLAGHFHPTIAKAARTIPGKAYIYRQMNKPMILGDTPANRELFRESDGGVWFVERGNPEQLAQCIQRITDQIFNFSCQPRESMK